MKTRTATTTRAIEGISGTVGLGACLVALALGRTRVLGTGRNVALLADVKAIAPDRIDVDTVSIGDLRTWGVLNPRRQARVREMQQPPPPTIVVNPPVPDVIVNPPPSPSTAQTVITLILPVLSAILAAVATHVFAQQRAKADAADSRRREELGYAAAMLAAAIPWVRAAEYCVQYMALKVHDEGLAEIVARHTEKLNVADREFLIARTTAKLAIGNVAVMECIKKIQDSYDSFTERFDQARRGLGVKDNVAECRRFRELLDQMNSAVAANYAPKVKLGRSGK
ncbi:MULTISPECIES: hypothetical protein [Amycolatopsis]|uniref:Uncharacterized protein n=1 Tax=Amycolatopsis bullii TaxID=941987 RepID=A0ABQ3KP65_9PSEU|nr:hypothetical protein [Amycolatopsis bullii]GHG41125.1 hypothetical protein GCM10017567_73260 [Amycolatopsis bullii]